MDTNQSNQQNDSGTTSEVSADSADSGVDKHVQQEQAQSAQPIDPKIKEMIVALPQEAQDTDLIEKEWVEKAKRIVEHTSDDPYVQQNELSKMKADYMKKRYNKDIKVSDT
jgi:hypothetical protein